MEIAAAAISEKATIFLVRFYQNIIGNDWWNCSPPDPREH
jgi:hypothetical protein